MPETQLETVEADTAFGKYKITGANLNNLATFAGLIGIVLLCWMVYSHAGDQKEGARAIAAELKESNKEVAQVLKDSQRELSQVLKEMARTLRENNCLQGMPVNQSDAQRQRNAETCKRLSQ